MQQVPDTPAPHRALHPFLSLMLAIVELPLVALLGPILTQLLFLFGAGLGPRQILLKTSYVVGFMAIQAALTLLLIAVFLEVRAQHWTSMGWRGLRGGRELAVALAVVPLLFVATYSVALFFRVFLPQFVSSSNPLLELVRTPADLAAFLVTSVLVGGFAEEVQRAFALTRFELIAQSELLGVRDPERRESMRRIGLGIGLVLWSGFFAVGHTVQGVDNAVGAGVLGFLFGVLFLWRRSLASPMVAHALYDVMTLVMFWTFFR